MTDRRQVTCCACKRDFDFSKSLFQAKGWLDPKFCKGCYYLWYRTCADKGIRLDPKKEIDTTMFEQPPTSPIHIHHIYESDLEGDNVGEYWISDD